MPRKRKVPVVDEEKENDGELSQNSTIHHGPMYTIMSNVQLNETFHKKYIREMQQLYGKMDHDAFMFMFIKMIKSAMEGEETNEYAYTTLLFCAKFIAAYDVDDTHPVLADTCRWLLTTISQNPHIRFRLCQFVNMILNALGVEAALDDAICDGILEYMLRRLRDMNPNVRVQSILALQRLQCPDNPDDIVLRVYQFHLCADPSPRVRQAVITSMGRNYNTIPYILDRLWDIDEKVRRHTYLHMSGYPVKAYKVSQRLQLLEQGLNDRSEMVKKVVTTIMLPQWLESYNKDYIMFVSALKLDSSEAEVERFLKIAKVALREIFKRQKKEDLVACVPLEEDGEFHKCVPHEKLTMEVTLYWQCLIDHLQAEMADELDMIIPELSTFCAYVLKFCESQKTTGDKFAKMEFQYILLSLCEILYLYDLGDEIGRGNLKKLISIVLKTYDLEEKVIEVIVKCTENLISDQNTRLQFFVEIIEEITNTSSFKTEALFNDRSLVDELLEKNPDQDLKLKLSSLKVKIMDLEEQEMNYVEMKDYVQAHRITEEKNAHLESYRNLLKPLLEKHSMNSESSSDQSKNQQKKVTTETILKSLQLAFYMVVSKNVKTLTPNVCKLYKEFIGRHIASSQIAIRDWSLKCGTAYSMLYEPLAKEIYEVLYAQFFKNHNIRIWKTSITCIFELLDRYGCSSFNVEERQNKTKRNGRQLYNTLEFLDADDDSSVWTSGQAVDIIFMMSHFLDTCDDVCIISAIVNGFCRLVLHDHVKSADILEKLLLRYFNPSTDPEINQILGVFLENLIQRKKQEYLYPCLLPTISQVISAPYESPLHEIKPETILRFVIDATRPEFCAPNANIHNKIALSLLQEMQNNIANKDLCKVLSKELLTLELSVKDDLPFKENLKGIAEKLINCEFDPKTLKNIVDFKDMLDGTFNPPPRHANLDGSDEEDKSDDDTVSAITTERDPEKTVAVNETTSQRLAPLLEDDKESEQETEAEKEPVTTNAAPKATESEKKNEKEAKENEEEAETEKESETENTKEVEISKELGSAVEPSTTLSTETARTPIQLSRQQNTPTTFGRENSTSLRYLRKSMNFSRQKSTPDEGPSPKIRIEARIDSIPSATPPKVQKMNDRTRQTRRNVRNVAQSETPVARNDDPTTSKPRHATRSSKTATTSAAASVGNKRKSDSNEKDNSSSEDSDGSDVIPPSPPSTSASESIALRPVTRRVNRALRFNNIQNQKTAAQQTKTNEATSSSGNVSSTNARIEKVASQASSSGSEDDTDKESSTKTKQNKQQPAFIVTKSVEKRITKSRNPVLALRRGNNPSPANVVRKETKQKTAAQQTKTNETIRSTGNVSSTNAHIEIVTSQASSSVSEDDTDKESSRKTPKINQQSAFIVTKSVEKRITTSRNPVLALRRRNNPSLANVVRKGNISDAGSEPAVRKTRKRMLSPSSTNSSVEGDKECASPLRKQSKTSVNISEMPETRSTNNNTTNTTLKTNTTKQQSPVTNKLRAKNSNVPESSAQRKRSTRSAANKNISPSSKENEPKPPSKRVSSYQSTSSSADTSSSSDEESTMTPPKNKQQSKFLITKSVENRIMSSRNTVLNLQQTKNTSSVGRVSTRNSARKERQNSMIMTRRRLSLEKTRSPSKTIITMSKSPVGQKKSTTSNAVPSKASKIPVNVALRSNKSNSRLDKTKGSTSTSIATSEDSSTSSDDSSAQKNRGKTMLPQPKATAQPRVNSTMAQKLKPISTRPSRIVRSTRNADIRTMRHNKNI